MLEFRDLELTDEEKLRYILCKVEVINILENYDSIYDTVFNEDLICSKVDLDAALDKLEERDKELLFLYYFKGYKLEEIGHMEEISHQAVSQRIIKNLHILVENCLSF